MKSKPLVSVILPVFNGGKFIAETLESVFAQTYPHMEVIVVDDGSTDNSGEIARTFQLHYHFQPNQGVGAARNTGISLAKGDLIAFIDADDIWEKEKIRKQVDVLMKDSELGYVLTLQELSLVSGVTRKPAWVREGQINKAIPGYLPSTLMVRKPVFELVGLFDPRYQTGSDGDWFFRARDKGIPMKIIQELLVFRKVHAANQSNAVAEVHADLLSIAARSVGRKRRKEKEENHG